MAFLWLRMYWLGIHSHRGSSSSYHSARASGLPRCPFIDRHAGKGREGKGRREQLLQGVGVSCCGFWLTLRFVNLSADA
ncbi:hypothetical protein E2C01_058525 [Portunus trituberculatus]|uniref:Uncharacterized protein n=1 Tax=Portunus trituberculatus TaxID=210409 RepID=A0A5B7GWP5_PORTR|nr:hypothetical protein [Portunus trituberculatus]